MAEIPRSRFPLQARTSMLTGRTTKRGKRHGSTSISHHTHHILLITPIVNITQPLTTLHHSFPRLQHFSNILLYHSKIKIIHLRPLHIPHPNPTSRTIHHRRPRLDSRSGTPTRPNDRYLRRGGIRTYPRRVDR